MFNEIGILTQEINKVCPITGLSEKGKTYFIHFDGVADEDQRAAAQYIVDNKATILDKYYKLDELDKNFADSIDEGFTTSYGWKLGLKNDDVLLLSSLFLLSKTAAEMNLPIPEIIDTDGNSHALTIEELTILMLNYGDRKSTRLNSSHVALSRMPSSA